MLVRAGKLEPYSPVLGVVGDYPVVGRGRMGTSIFVGDEVGVLRAPHHAGLRRVNGAWAVYGYRNGIGAVDGVVHKPTGGSVAHCGYYDGKPAFLVRHRHAAGGESRSNRRYTCAAVGYEGTGTLARSFLAGDHALFGLRSVEGMKRGLTRFKQYFPDGRVAEADIQGVCAYSDCGHWIYASDRRGCTLYHDLREVMHRGFDESPDLRSALIPRITTDGCVVLTYTHPTVTRVYGPDLLPRGEAETTSVIRGDRYYHGCELRKLHPIGFHEARTGKKPVAAQFADCGVKLKVIADGIAEMTRERDKVLCRQRQLQKLLNEMEAPSSEDERPAKRQKAGPPAV